MKIKIKGVENLQFTDPSFDGFELAASFRLTRDRDISGMIEVEEEATSIAQVVFEDGVEWLGYLGDIHEILDPKSSREIAGEGLVISATSGLTTERGVKEAVLRFLNIFRADPAKKYLVKELGSWVDKKVMPEPGLYLVNDQLAMQRITEEQIDASRRYLLLIHGTFSSAEGSFGDLRGESWRKIYQRYEGRVLAFNHYTISESPVENAIDILASLPQNLIIDVMSASRGGLVADILVRCDSRNKETGFSETEKEILAGHDKIREQIDQLNRLAVEKSIQVNNQVRVACPAGGTILLQERLDHFLNFILNAIGFALPGNVNIAYYAVKEFLMRVIKSRADVESMPGLWCQVPDSDYQKANNIRSRELITRLYVIAGDAEQGGGLANSLKVILANLYFRVANDFVVDTGSMKRGLSRTEGMYYFLSKTNKSSHFGYFRNTDSLECVLQALDNNPGMPAFSFQLLMKEQMDRGIRPTFGYGPYNKTQVSGQRPVLVLLPGIMGSTLRTSAEIWLDFMQIADGKIVTDLPITSEKVKASGVVERYYRKMAEYFSRDYDVYTFPYDWRKSLKEAAGQLYQVLEKLMAYGQPVRIVAHSMGGLVVRQLMLDYKVFWETYIEKKDSRFVMLGTPWKGSYLIMEVLTGYSRRIRQLRLLDYKHGQLDLLKVIGAYPGVYELLPVDHRPFEEAAFWARISRIVGERKMLQPSAAVLEHFRQYKEKIRQGFADYSFDNIYYIAGQASTVHDYEEKAGFFRGSYLEFTETEEGDGSVTWRSGIPENLKRDNLYYSNVEHGNLANEETIFAALKDLLREGQTSRLSRQQPSSDKRGAFIPQRTVTRSRAFFGSEEEIIENLFNDGYKAPDQEPAKDVLEISVLNADLKYASYPVMAGHFRNDGLYSAERALDIYLGNKLSARHSIGFYPQDIGESQVVFHVNDQPKGALIVGLGLQGELTPYKLAKSVQAAILRYAFFFRDNYEDPAARMNGKAISAVLIGSAFGGLGLADCIRAVIKGVEKANEKIRILDHGLETIETIEIVNYFEDVAQQTYWVLKELEQEVNYCNIVVTGFRVGIGNRKRMLFEESKTWWHTFTTEVIHNTEVTPGRSGQPLGLNFTSSAGIARVEKNDVRDVLKWAEKYAADFSHQTEWNKDLSKVLFELLIPNDFKDTIRNQNNIIWKMDEYAAQFPWEMFNDNDFSNEPAFVNTGFVRQLILNDYRPTPVVAAEKNALIIGDPDYSNTAFPQLPRAKEEAELVHNILKEDGFDTAGLFRASPQNIINQLFKHSYKVLHIAAHGVYDAENAGVVLGDGLYLTPAIINQLSSVPEFVFINCCYSGDFRDLGEKFYKDRAKLASNIGPQLIRMGVKAVVVAGWAVDDAAAKVFAEELYRKLLEGYEFGTASQRARRICYDLYKHTNTWGAYQCYGDHFYKLVNRTPGNVRKVNYVTETQALIDVTNLLSKVKGQKVNVEKTLRQLAVIREHVAEAGLESAPILENYAFILAELGEYGSAIEVLDSLRSIEKANFSVVALEQYMSLRGKHLVVEYKRTKQFSEEKLVNLLKDLSLVSLIGATSERLALVGSANKRAAYLDLKKRKVYLRKMKSDFKEAYERIRHAPLEDTIYALSNFLTAHFFINYGKGFYGKSNQGVLRELGIDTSADVNAYLSALLEQLEQQKQLFKEYYKSNAVYKILLCRFLYSKDAREEDAARVLDSLMESVDNYANIKNIMGEVEHLDFILHLLKSEPHKKLLQRLSALLETRLKYTEENGMI